MNIVKHLRTFLDYNYYRVARFYFRREGTNAATALVHVSLIVSTTFAPIIIFSLIIFFAKFSIPWGTGKGFIKIFAIIYYLLIYFIISRHYRERGIYLILRDRWYSESKRKRVLKGFGVILSILVPLLICIVILVNRDNIAAWFEN